MFCLTGPVYSATNAHSHLIWDFDKITAAESPLSMVSPCLGAVLKLVRGANNKGAWPPLTELTSTWQATSRL